MTWVQAIIALMPVLMPLITTLITMIEQLVNQVPPNTPPAKAMQDALDGMNKVAASLQAVHDAAKVEAAKAP